MSIDVSIIVAAYNAAAFIDRSLSSALAQDFERFEVIVVDDRSTDDTFARLEAAAARDPRLRVFRQAINQGPAAARNRGIDEAHGTWIAVLDADDAYLPTRLRRLVTAAEANNLDVVADNLLLFDMDACTTAGTAFRWPAPMVPLDLETLFAKDRIGIGQPLGWMKPLMRRAFLEKHQLRYNESLRYSEDFFLYVELLALGAKAVLLDDAHYIYTTRTGLVSRRKSNRSRTLSDPLAVASSCDTLLARYGAMMSFRARKLLETRKSDGMDFHTVGAMRADLVARRPLAMLARALRHPNVIRFIARYTRWKIEDRWRRHIAIFGAAHDA